MADIHKLVPKILLWEGGYVDDPADKGGATNMGVTIATWQQLGHDKDGDGKITKQDIKMLGYNDMVVVLETYWDKWKANEINNQSIAEILVDWIWASGAWGIIIPQRILHVAPDGIVGPKTLAVLNGTNQLEFFNKVKTARLEFVDEIVSRSKSQKKFEAGWKRRINSYTFEEEKWTS